MLAPFAAPQFYLFIFITTFVACTLLSGAMIALIQQNLNTRRAQRPQTVAILAARPLSLILLIVLQACAWLIFLFDQSSADAGYFVCCLTFVAGLLLVACLLPVSRAWHSDRAAVLLLLLSCTCFAVLSFGPPLPFFDPARLWDRGLEAGLMVVFALLFMRLEATRGSGVLALIVLGLAFAALPLIVPFIDDVLAAPLIRLFDLTHPDISASWPDLWRAVGFLLLGLGLGWLYWVGKGTALYLGFEGRLVMGFLFGCLVLKLVQLSSFPMVFVCFMPFFIEDVARPLFSAIVHTLGNKRGKSQNKKRVSPSLLGRVHWRFPTPARLLQPCWILPLLALHGGFVVLAALTTFWAAFWPFITICLAGLVGLTALWALRKTGYGL